KTSLDKKVNKIIEKVKLVADVDKFPDGVKTIVDLDKENLSGGQKQKVILARAEIHDSQLLLIDEGTSAIDSGATKRIIKELLKSDQTIIMIAHNFSKDLISLFDKRINLNEGAN
ncbi:ATP-binding cassette domain-containing protein, partial [Lactobacillus helveticus]